MKRIILAVFALMLSAALLTLPGTSMRQAEAVNVTSSNHVTADITYSKNIDHTDEVISGTGVFYGIIVRTDGVNNATVNVYDGVANRKKPLIPYDTVVSGPDFKCGLPIKFNPGIPYTSDIYVDVQCAGTVSIQVLYYKW